MHKAATEIESKILEIRILWELLKKEINAVILFSTCYFWNKNAQYFVVSFQHDAY